MEHTEHPLLATDLFPLVHQQRRLLAGSLRIMREEKELREKIALLLDEAGVSQCTVRAVAGQDMHVFIVERDGRRFAVINPIKG